ncbi:TrkH-domain-containing protein [Bimuria novae-zelandiae CBS 107.79]|uniref:TrkH-domain-containing protein n=1 Tax=Bimuria novae-zelandiae CBS 107.79 TaxID=1447943 RepID=A0A6A5VCN5_9PLEO|nr:TrkH-domain-containing protein [Bimuria novae-zelandiae CBS 107.79]
MPSLARVPGLWPLRRITRALRARAPSLNFITLHYMYFIFTCLLASVIFWGASTPARSVSYTDSLFLVVSAMTLAGLNTVNLSTLNTFQQCMLFFLILLGSAILVSGFVVHVRLRSFEHRFEYVTEKRRQRAARHLARPRLLARTLSRSLSGSRSRNLQAERPSTITYRDKVGNDAHIDTSSSPENGPPPHITFGPSIYHYAEGSSTNHRHHHRFMGVGADPHVTIKRRPTSASNTTSDIPLDAARPSSAHLPFTSSGFLSRNSHFHHLTEKEREKLGGYEYRAVRLLSWLVPAYYILFQLFGCIGLGAYVAMNKASVTWKNGLNPWWVGAFNAVSAFNNSGMSLLDANMVAFQTSAYMLITMGLLILAGNTAYPIFLRLIVWTLLKLLPKNERCKVFRETLQFLLDHPRRCYTNMFPSRHTWWLLSCLVCLNGIDWAAFEILNIGNTGITDSLSTGFEVLVGLFQALAVRSGGFYVVTIPLLPIALQVLYVVMMYISVYPVVITMRNSNVYEERSLGIYADDPGYAAAQSSSARGLFGKLRRTMTGETFEHTKSYFVRQQLRAQLAHDLWSVVLAVFVIMIIEGSKFKADPVQYSVFNVVFETVSAYGCVGISVGVPNDAYSFSGGLRTLSKLVLCAVMIRGRHRGLPVAIDKAVLLPGERVDVAEEEDGEIRMERTISRGRVV